MGRPDAPSEAELAAGPLSATFRDGDLLDVRLGGDLILDRAYVAVRDRDWGTAALQRTVTRWDSESGSFAISYDARTADPGLPIDLSVRFEGDASRLSLAVSGVARGTLWANRIGFCLLHPLTLAGTRVDFVGDPASGAFIQTGEFPARIKATTLFGEVSGFAYRTHDGHQVRFAFEGDLFETEDQRNWIDASYKTYCTPLRLPYPKRLEAGDRIEQTISITFESVGRISPRPARQNRSVVRIGERTWQRPEVGIGVSTGRDPLGGDGLSLARSIAPRHLSVELDLRANWAAAWSRACSESSQLGPRIDAILISDDPVLMSEWVGSVAGDAKWLSSISGYDARTHISEPEVVTALRTALKSHGIQATVGGGTRAHFSDLNRMTFPPGIDFARYTVTPQVHATDSRSIMQTPAALAVTVTDARALAGSVPIWVGPITFAQRFNSVATSGQEPDSDPDELADARQAGPEVAVWTVGVLAALAGADRASLFDLAGAHGVMRPTQQGNAPFDVARVLSWWARQPSAMAAVDVDGSSFCLAARHADGSTNVLLANPEPHKTVCQLFLGAGEVELAPISLGPLAVAALIFSNDGKVINTTDLTLRGSV